MVSDLILRNDDGDAGGRIRRARFILAIAIVLLVGSVALNFALAEKLRLVTTKNSRLEAESKVHLGTAVPDIEGRSIDGSMTAFSFSTHKRGTVVYIFSPICGWCEKNRQNVQALYTQLSKDYQFIALSISNKGVGDFVARHEIPFPVIIDPSPDTVSSFKLGSTPQTFLVSPDAIVVRSWLGAYMSSTQKDIEGHFGVELPGVR